jgi:Tol biopolymer transport system component
VIRLASLPLVLLLGAVLAPATQDAAPQPMFAEPAISPDRAEIAFVSGGDIWAVPAAGGLAHLLVSHPATESRPLYSPDGTRLAFVSTRTGNGDIYLLTLATGELVRLTWDDQLDQLDAWSPDGRWIYFTSGAQDVAGQNDVFRVSAEGGTPMPVSADRYANEYWSQPSPDGAQLAITARGTVSGQWWRRGHSHLDESEIWVLRDATAMRYDRLSEGGQKDAWPMWSADGRSIWFVRDRQGIENVWARPAAGGGEARQVTRFTDGRVLWPTIARDGAAIVFERNFRVWLLETASGEAREIPITLRGAPAGAAAEHLALSSGFSDLALSPDGKKVAFVAHGEVFAASAKDGGDAFRVTRTPAREQQVAWSPDSKRVVYTSDRAGYAQLYQYDFTTREEMRLTDDPGGDVNPRYSTDGRQVVFARGSHALCAVDVGTKAVRTLATGLFDRQPFTSTRAEVFSPDGRWVAYLSTQGRQFNTVFVVPLAGGEARPASFLSNVFGSTLAWSPDGTFILFDTGQRTEEGQLARIDLVPRTPRFREDQFRDLFTSPTRPASDTASRDTAATRRPAAPARGTRAAAGPVRTPAPAADTTARKATEITFEEIRQRLTILPVGVDVGSEEIAPDGKSVVVTGSSEGQTNLYAWSLDELSREDPVARQLTSTAGFKSSVQFAPDGKDVWYLEGGRIRSVNVESRTVKSLDVTAEMDVDFAQEKLVVFDEAWRYLRDNFADSTMHGTDWAATRRAIAPYAMGARTGDELRRLLSLMIGELNGSHLGIGSPGGGSVPATGRLGLAFDRAEVETPGRFRVTEVLPLGPAAIAGVAVGDYLVAVDGVPLGARVSLSRLLTGTVGRRVDLTLSRQADGSTPREVAARPIGTGAERQLRYRQWVEQKRAYVARISNGRLGYVHMPDMGGGSLQQLYVDLDAENMDRQGVVVDIRHNNGGFVNAYAIDVFARRGYLTMIGRGASPAPARTILGQRSLERPTVLVVDQHSLSDAEDFTEGYRALKLGSVVGEPTAGWIIYTSNIPVVDGTIVRIPFTQVLGSDGQPMEMHPRPVDVRVDRPIGESYTGRDSQLDAAVETLLRQMGGR